jgi:hypothetical protein
MNVTILYDGPEELKHMVTPHINKRMLIQLYCLSVMKIVMLRATPSTL